MSVKTTSTDQFTDRSMDDLRARFDDEWNDESEQLESAPFVTLSGGCGVTVCGISVCVDCPIQ